MDQLNEQEVLLGIADALEVSPNMLTLESKASDLEEWDSLGHISIMAFLDRAFNDITERVPDFASATSVQEILAILREQNS